MKKISPKQYAQALYQALDGVGKDELTKRVHNFLTLLTRRQDIKMLNKIFNNFVEIYQQERGIVEAGVTSAKPLTVKVKQEILNWIKQYTGRTADLQEALDPSLLGGLVVQFGYTVVDGSLSHNLHKLQGELIK